MPQFYLRLINSPQAVFGYPVSTMRTSKRLLPNICFLRLTSSALI